jgi:hypothetical protein
MARKPDARKWWVRVNPTMASQSKLEGVDTIVDRSDSAVGVRFGSEFWVGLLGFVILEIAIAIGWIAAAGGRLKGNWNTILIALAAAALGFGAAHLLARRSADTRGRELERDYEQLRERSRRLLEASDKLEKRSPSFESSASSETAP